ncbi:hypothetical protein [Sphingomonas immobilis]|uniref:DUF4148 domain-containing protein n=1 Tax=Sphingomonas immobilis TaxID=3063997 RepID=A0ABT9A1S1_9SPHN|nr:hypothetical protein [Sphingomonas sp. CA1-15]MDO7842946.1 hypothetical protein [Sphingomonas sp. CA1-15]
MMRRGAWIAIALMAAPMPATAQFRAPVKEWSPAAPVYAGSADTAKIRRDIDHGRNAGQLSRRDAYRQRREANQIDTLSDRYGGDGMSDAEARELDTRARVLDAQVAAHRTQAITTGKKP